MNSVQTILPDTEIKIFLINSDNASSVRCLIFKQPKMKIAFNAKCVDPDETANNKLPNLDLYCLPSCFAFFQYDLAWTKDFLKCCCPF